MNRDLLGPPMNVIGKTQLLDHGGFAFNVECESPEYTEDEEQ